MQLFSPGGKTRERGGQQIEKMVEKITDHSNNNPPFRRNSFSLSLRAFLILDANDMRLILGAVLIF